MSTTIVLRLSIALFVVVFAGMPLASAHSVPLQLAQEANAAPQHEHPAPAPPPQHEHPQPPPDASAQHEHQHGATPSLFSTRDASGTAWLSDITPMYGLHGQIADWEVMLHGNLFLQLLDEHAPEHRGATQAGSINWVMGMARRELGATRVGLRGMMSLEPWTISGCGYPNLLATGEFCGGDTIHDKQHPHDLFMELAAEFDRPLFRSLRWGAYGGPVGEPALGPPAFPHRISALPNPLSPIAHHWLDATHISFGVVTAGVYDRRWKVEGSLFNGREPDERRYDFDFAALDSVAGRLWFLPTPSLALQVSLGHLIEAEPSHTGGPPVDIDRFTTSATYHRPFGTGHFWATTVAWGANRELGQTTHGIIAESAVTFSGRHAWFGRAEVNGKPADDLHVHELRQVFTVGKLQGGYTRYFAPRRGLMPGIGASVSAALVPEALEPRYGGVGTGVGVFVTLRPPLHEMVQ
jgi:hypothetical protein